MDRRVQQTAISISRMQQFPLSQCMCLNCHTLRSEGWGKANWVRLHATCSIISKRIFHCDTQPGLPLGLSYFLLVDLVRPNNLWSATKEQTTGWVALTFHPRLSFNHTSDLPPTVSRAPAVPTLFRSGPQPSGYFVCCLSHVEIQGTWLTLTSRSHNENILLFQFLYLRCELQDIYLCAVLVLSTVKKDYHYEGTVAIYKLLYQELKAQKGLTSNCPLRGCLSPEFTALALLWVSFWICYED